MTAGPATTGPHKFGTVRTLLDDVPMERLGRCDYHEHLFQASPLLVGDELDDEQASRQEAESLRRAGIDAFIDATLRVSGAILAPSPVSVSRRGIAVVHVSGAHHQGHYGSTHWLLEAHENDLLDRFLADVRDGLPDSHRQQPGVTALERQVMTSAFRKP
jgi:5-phospho-D-xylono-1,4-lactonase